RGARPSARARARAPLERRFHRLCAWYRDSRRYRSASPYVTFPLSPWGGSMRKTCVALLVLAFASPLAWSQAFPNRPIRVIVPFTAGSGSDTSARFFGEKISALLGQPVVVENKPGANAVIAVMAVKSAPADGYSILLASTSPMSVNPLALKDLPYDPLKDLKPLSGLTRGMNVLVIAPGSSIKTLAELVAAAKKAPAPL